MTQLPSAKNCSMFSISTLKAGMDMDEHEFVEFLADQNPIDANAANWLVRRQDGLAAFEENEFQEWLRADPLHGITFNRLEGILGLLETLPSDDISRLKTDLVDIRHKRTVVIDRAQTNFDQTKQHSSISGRRAWIFNLVRFVPQLAVASIAFAVVGSSWLGWHYWQGQPIFTKTYTTIRGQQLTEKLLDGSSITLDTMTLAEFRLYRDRREVRLSEGQAIFSVKADATKPFDVLAGPLRITVVGTRFGVRTTQTGLYPDSVSVVVEEGRVRVEHAKADATHSRKFVGLKGFVELTAGQSIQTDAAGYVAKIIDQSVAGALLWREGRINFEGTPLSQALAEFERYGPTKFAINDPRLGEMRINGSFDLRQVDAFTKALPQVLPVRLQIQNGITEVVATYQ